MAGGTRRRAFREEHRLTSLVGRQLVWTRTSCFGYFPQGRAARTGDCFGPKAVYRIWSSVEARRTEADIPGFQLRDLRYTCATRLADIGEELVTVAEILGHTDIRMTRRYSHDMQERKREALERSSPSRDVNLTQKRRNYKNGRVRTLP